MGKHEKTSKAKVHKRLENRRADFDRQPADAQRGGRRPGSIKK